jgi:hypothetical protein
MQQFTGAGSSKRSVLIVALERWARVGLQNVLITLSADHGFMNVPEYSQSRWLDAGRIDPDKMIAATNAALSEKFGEGKYITAWWNPTLYVDYKLIEDWKLNKVEVENAAQAFLRDYPGVEAVFTRTQMEQGMMRVMGPEGGSRSSRSASPLQSA